MDRFSGMNLYELAANDEFPSEEYTAAQHGFDCGVQWAIEQLKSRSAEFTYNAPPFSMSHQAMLTPKQWAEWLDREQEGEK